MSITKGRGLRALGIVCASTAILASIPVGAAFAGDTYPGPNPNPSASDPKGDPKLIEALEKAPELQGATFDVSGVTLETGKPTTTNEVWKADDHIFFDHDYSNFVRKMPDGRVQPDEPYNSVADTFTHTDTFAATKRHDFSFGVTVGYSYATAVEAGIDSTSTTNTHTYKAEFNFVYKYGQETTTTKSDARTVTSSAQTMMVPPGWTGRIRQWVDVGTYDADITVPGTLRGDVVMTKCGQTVRMPIGRLAAMKRDDDQGPLFPGTTTDGDVLREEFTAHWSANVAAKGHTEKVWTPIAEGSSPSIDYDSSEVQPAPSTSPSPTTRPSATPKARRLSSTGSPETKTLRGLVPCSTLEDLNTSPGLRWPYTPVAVGAVAVGNHLFLTKDKALRYGNITMDVNIDNIVADWSTGGQDWATYVRTDGRAYSWRFFDNLRWYDGTYPSGTRAVGNHAYLTPNHVLYYKSNILATNVSSATGGWVWGSDWLTYVSDGTGYVWDAWRGTPTPEAALPPGSTAVGNHTYLSPNGSLHYADKVIATAVTSAKGGWGVGRDWVTFVANGRGCYWDNALDRPQDELSLPPTAVVVGNHAFLDASGYLYYKGNEVMSGVSSAVGGWGIDKDWVSFVRDGN